MSCSLGWRWWNLQCESPEGDETCSVKSAQSPAYGLLVSPCSEQHKLLDYIVQGFHPSLPTNGAPALSSCSEQSFPSNKCKEQMNILNDCCLSKNSGEVCLGLKEKGTNFTRPFSSPVWIITGQVFDSAVWISFVPIRIRESQNYEVTTDLIARAVRK